MSASRTLDTDHDSYKATTPGWVLSRETIGMHLSRRHHQIAVSNLGAATYDVQGLVGESTDWRDIFTGQQEPDIPEVILNVRAIRVLLSVDTPGAVLSLESVPAPF